MPLDIFLSSWAKRTGISKLILAVAKVIGPGPARTRDLKAMSNAIAPSTTTLLAMSLACMCSLNHTFFDSFCSDSSLIFGQSS